MLVEADVQFAARHATDSGDFFRAETLAIIVLEKLKRPPGWFVVNRQHFGALTNRDGLGRNQFYILAVAPPA